jgi:hypothetical protein
MTEEFSWDKELSSLTSALGQQNFLAEAEFRDKIMAAGEALGVNEDRIYTKEQTEFLASNAKQIKTYIRSWFLERDTNLDDSKDVWFGDFLFTCFAYHDFYASVSYYPSRNDSIAVISFNEKVLKESFLTGNPVEIWTTIETVKLDLSNL